MNSEILPGEKLFRKVITNPNYWKSETGRPSSAIFKDSKGCSVDRDGNRNDKEVISSFIDKFKEENVRAIVYVNASHCFEIGAHVIYKPEHDNHYHSEIHNSQTRIDLTRGMAKRLVDYCTIVYPYWE